MICRTALFDVITTSCFNSTTWWQYRYIRRCCWKLHTNTIHGPPKRYNCITGDEERETTRYTWFATARGLRNSSAHSARATSCSNQCICTQLMTTASSASRTASSSSNNDGRCTGMQWHLCLQSGCRPKTSISPLR